MKKNIAILLCAFTLMATISGCDSGLAKFSGNGNSAESQESASASAEGNVDASTEGVTETPEAEEPATEGTETADGAAQEAAAGESASEADTGAEAASQEAAAPADEIVEPEIKEETVENPVEVEPNAVSDVDDAIDIVFIGDSQFDNARGTGSDIPTYTQALLQGKTNVYNLAIGGTPASLERTKSDNLETWNDTCFLGVAYAISGDIDRSIFDAYPMRAVLDTIDPKKVDFYVIEYGANDYINGKELNNSDQFYDKHTFSGALEVGIGVLKGISPNAKIILCSPSYSIWYNADGFQIGDSYTTSKGIGTLSDYADIAGNVAERGGYTYIDTMYSTYFDLGPNTADDYLSDGLHYNEKGRQIYATTIAHFINKALGIDPNPMDPIQINEFHFGS